MVVSEMMERLSPNMAPPTTDPSRIIISRPPFCATPTAIGVIAAMVPIEVPQAVLMSIAMMKQPATRNCVGTKDRPRFTTASRPPMAVATAENEPDRAKITSMMITPSSATPRANTENFSLILPFP